MTPDYLSAIGNHLWQSTLFAATVALLTLAFRNNSARVRYWLWLIASIKFLIPFSLLVTLGARLEWRTAPAQTRPAFSYVVDQFSEPFTASIDSLQISLPPTPSPSPIPIVSLVIWISGLMTVGSYWLRRWLLVRAAVRASSPLHLELSIPVRCSPTILEPGVFGIVRPVIVLPAGITEHLTQPQLGAILAHELCHARRRDNLAASVHMLIESIFWFHPLLWWIGSRLVDEREQACDEEVLRLGSEPQAYAEGILRVCKFYLASPMPCLSGVSGSNLKQRIERIMTQGFARRLDYGRKFLLATAAISAVAIPLVIGLINAPPSSAQEQKETPSKLAFDVASIKLNKSGNDGETIGIQPGGRLNIQNMPVRSVIKAAYKLSDYEVSGGPDWINSERYDILAKSESASNPDKLLLMLGTLLEGRFNLKAHRETQQGPVYLLKVAKGGAKMQRAEGSCVPRDPNNPPPRPAPGETGPNYCGNMHGGKQELHGRGVSIGKVGITPLGTLSGQLASILDRTVIDETGLDGIYNFDLAWTPDLAASPLGGGSEPAESSSPSIFTALQEQLGLRLEAARGPVEMFVIDQIERPSDNSAAETNVPRSSMGRHPQFAVASVKQNNSGDGGAFCNSIPLSCYSLMAKPGLYEAKNEPMRVLIAAAYGLTPVQKREISGGPKWIDSLRFDIEAKAEGNPSIDQRRLMLQDLLANRFKLVVHRTTKQSPMFALRLVNAGKTGPKLISHLEATDCLDVAAGPPPGGFTSTNAFCGGFLNLNKSGLGHLDGNNVTLDSLAVALSGLPEVDRTVLDQTGLQGTFDIALEYTLNAMDDRAALPSDPAAPPSLTQALNEQLGLKLEPTQGPVELLVIDHAELPSEN